ncbi:serine/threonine-protein kinase KIN2 [Entophlyctis sp. JEL0112]|nr:serine/threonine-protein kinase KIN2 [Entophlyctis sp. JEL0112]
MEYVEGGELFDFIVANPKLNEKIARKIFRQIVSAIDYCHQSSVIHRDLKPENLLLDNDKNIKIIDFGFVNLYDPADVLKTFCGSPFYASPEMILGKKYIGPEVDIWSMGVILFALLAGKLPFKDSNVKDLYRKITSATFEIPSNIGKDSSNLICAMLKANPAERISLSEIKSHVWVNTTFESIPDSLIPHRPPLIEPLDQNILSTMRLYGFDDEQSRKAILSSTTSPAFLLYYLVKEHDSADQNRRELLACENENKKRNQQTEKHTATAGVEGVRRRKSIAAFCSPPELGAITKLKDPKTADSSETVGLESKVASINLNSVACPEADVSQRKASLRARKSMSSAPPIGSPRLRIDTARSKLESFAVSSTNCEGKENTSSTTSQQTFVSPTRRERHKSFSLKYTSNKFSSAATADGLKESTSGSAQNSTSGMTITSPCQTAKKGSLPRRTSFTNKITQALSKIIPRSRRGSVSPESSYGSVSSCPRVSKNIYSVDTTSNKSPDDIQKELNRAMDSNGITPKTRGSNRIYHTVSKLFLDDFRLCRILGFPKKASY